MKTKLGAAYWKLWSATAISNLGDGVSAIAYPWLASAVTRSPILIAAAGFASRLPWLIFTLHGYGGGSIVPSWGFLGVRGFWAKQG